MSKGGGPWREGRRAWDRLAEWHREHLGPRAHPGGGDDALDALADVGTVRRLLDQVELVAVRTARRSGKSWAEVATRLGVTRQSAWERWRELDEPGPASTAREQAVEAAAVALTAERATARRRQSSVLVPNVVGKHWYEARRLLHERHLVAVGPDPDAPPSGLQPEHAVVTDQSPESGAKVPPGSSVTLWVERGGGSGVREPRVPRPAPRAGRAMRPEPSDEAVG
ncbi:MAG TPA: PASTA domain-containing protein [Jatrophihabitans sp.]|nr:PASTA domain-containing protein [Jatrophihabitans sp.]